MAARRGSPGPRAALGTIFDIDGFPVERKTASSDDKSKTTPQDASRISMSEDYEVRYWTGKFGVTRDQLAKAVVAVGNSAKAVEAHLRRGAH